MSQNASQLRLNVYLQEAGVASRRKADELIKAGQVMVDGEVVNQMGVAVLSSATVQVNGKVVKRRLKNLTYLFHKPDRSLTTRMDPQGREIIFDLASLRSLPKNVQPVGRLDYRSEGLLVLTSDGDLAHTLTHPKFCVDKTYSVLISDLITPMDLERLRAGVNLEDGFAKPIGVRAASKEKLGTSVGQWVRVVVTEGRNRLVRRLFQAVGLRVLRLVRVGIGEVDLPADLRPGQIRPATAEEHKYLMSLKVLDSEMSVEKSAASKAKDRKTLGLKPKIRRKNLRLNDEDYSKKKIKDAMVLKQKEKERLELNQGLIYSSVRAKGKSSRKTP